MCGRHTVWCWDIACVYVAPVLCISSRVLQLYCLPVLRWADPREDEVINPAPGFWVPVGPLGPTAGPGSLGTSSGSKNSAACAKNQPRMPMLRPVRGYFNKINGEPEPSQGQPSFGLVGFQWGLCAHLRLLDFDSRIVCSV